MIRKLFWFFFSLFFVFLLIGSGLAVWGYGYITRDLPQLDSINDYLPASVTKVFASDGALIAEYYKERRYPVKFDEIPKVIREAFLAAEDASFYKHPGIDPWSIARAFVKNLQAGSTKQGASTITQQVVKNLLLTPERKIERKLKEAILSYRLEEKLTKNEIFEIYLNQIFLGNNSYGVKAAVMSYFHKDLKDVNLAEASLIAGLPKAPSKYSPLNNFASAKRRQRYVLDQMVKAGFVTKEEADRAADERVKLYPVSAQNVYAAPYFVSEVRKAFQDKFKNYDIDADGLQIYTTVDSKANELSEKALQTGLREVDKRRGWRGPIASLPKVTREEFQKQFESTVATEPKPDTVYSALVTEVSKAKGIIKVVSGSVEGSIELSKNSWIKKKLSKDDTVSWIKPEDAIHEGDVLEIVLSMNNEGKVQEISIDQTPAIEGALVLIDPNSGKIVAMQGGYSYALTVLNRSTQSYRQPGSTFKPIVYFSAIDGFKYTPATIVHDSPRTIKVGDEYWTPGNYDEKYLGPITLRTALEKSKNLVSVDIVSRIGIDPIIKYARLLGLTTPLGKNPSLALGSSEVTLLEMTRAYGVFAARGVLFDTYYIQKVLDRTGAVLYDHDNELMSNAQQVVNANSAFVMANVMKGVVEHGTGTAVKPINRPVAGKTGTTNDMMDAWFIGYTPQWVCGIWTGFDQKKEIGDKETGGKVAAPIWLKFMQPYLNYLDEQEYKKLQEKTKEESERLHIEYHEPEKIQPLDFQPPDGVVGMWVNKATGQPANAGEEGAIYEYFVKGTEPTEVQTMTEETASYLDSPDL